MILRVVGRAFFWVGMTCGAAFVVCWYLGGPR